MRHGHALVELATTLLLLAVLGAAALPPARRLGDRMAVVAAREAVAGLIAEARAGARRHGSASVALRAASGRVRAEAGGRTIRAVALEEELGVSLRIGRGRDSTDLSFDALGLGRVASLSLTLTRGEAAAGLTLSGYGRVRRR